MPLWLPVATPVEGTELNLFICQSWHELLHPQTPDSFRARVLDISLLLDDILHVAEIASDDRRWAKYFSVLAEELEDSLLSEQRTIPAESALWRAIQAVLKDLRDERVGALRSKVLVAKGLYGRPEERLCADLSELVASGSNKKEALLKRLSTIASHVEYRGLGTESLDSIQPSLLDLPHEDLLERITAPLRTNQREFSCTLAIAGKANELAEILRKTQFSRIAKRKLEEVESFRQWLEEHAECTYARITLTARSAHSAADHAMQLLAEALNVHNLYVNRASFRAFSSVIVNETGEDQEIGFVQVAPSSHFGLKPRSKALSLTVDRLGRVGHRLQGRLANALECHAIALAAHDSRTAIINLWTALETIAGSAEKVAIGNRVASVIAPIIAARRIDKIVTYLRLGIHEVLIHQKMFVDREHMKRSKYVVISNDDVLEAIAGPNGNSAIMYLLGLSEPSPLLRQRLYGAWKAFHDPQLVRQDLVASRKRVEWQILRIYRARNLLVHKGETSHLVWRLLQNAQYYVSASVSKVLHDLSDHESWGIDESLTYQSMHFDLVCDRLENELGVSHVDVLGTRSDDPLRVVWKKPVNEIEIGAVEGASAT